jgi:hypothetical protein
MVGEEHAGCSPARASEITSTGEKITVAAHGVID